MMNPTSSLPPFFQEGIGNKDRNKFPRIHYKKMNSMQNKASLSLSLLLEAHLI